MDRRGAGRAQRVRAVGAGAAALLVAGGVVVGVQVHEQRTDAAADARAAELAAERWAAAQAEAQVRSVDGARALVADRLAHLTTLEEARVAAERAAAEAEAEARRAEAADGAGDGSAGVQAAHPSTGVAWVAGAGPDCGGPASWEPPRDDGVPFFTSTPEETGDGSNGRMPRADLVALDWCRDSRGNAQWLVPAAAESLTRLNRAFRARFGENLAVDLSYRSYADQVAMREHYGSLAAEPGTSNHGLGTAIDVWEWAAYGFGSERYEWLVTNGPAYGWVAPGWARADGSNPEYWHLEHVG